MARRGGSRSTPAAPPRARRDGSARPTRPDVDAEGAAGRGRALLCDLGGVVVHVDATRCHRAWAALAGVPVGRAAGLFPGPAYERYERGEISSAAFLDEVRRALDVDATDDELVAPFTDIYGGVDHGTLAVLASVRDRGVPTSALTNTCALHEERWSVMLADALSLFDTVHSSFELGSRKPERACFETVLAREGWAAEDVVFVDDLAENVRAAQATGMIGVRFRHPDQLAVDLGIALAG